MKNIEKYFDELMEIGSFCFTLDGEGKPVPVKIEDEDELWGISMCARCFFSRETANKCYENKLEWFNEEYLPNLRSDDRVLVSNDRLTWHRGYFSHFDEMGRIHVFANGKGSWTELFTEEYRYWKVVNMEGE